VGLVTSRVVRRLIVLSVLAIAAVGCGSSAPSSSTSASTPHPSNSGGCRPAQAPAPRNETHLSAPSTRLDPAKTYTVTFVTNCGTFAMQLNVRRAPRTAASFAALVRRGFYDGLTFHRIAGGFVIQGGDPTGTGEGGPGYTVVEPPPSGYTYRDGDVAMAKTQAEPAGASGSQFFVLFGGAASLPPDYALAGHVVSGMDVVRRIGALVGPGGDGPPTQPVVMSRVTLATRP
jgi:cyclophilin family peptidyl-prolyl cis-trans isomerase